MLMALAVLALIDAAPSPTVELALTGTGNTPVSAAPRSLSDVARELREGRKAVGGFSAVETTVPQHLRRIPPVEWEEEVIEPEPEVVNEPEPPEVAPYVPVWYGAPRLHRGFRPGVRVRHALLGLGLRAVLPGPPVRAGGRSSLSPGGHGRRRM